MYWLVTLAPVWGGGGTTPEISQLTLTISGTDHTATIKGTKITVELPFGSAIPESATVKSVTLSEKATGLATGDLINLNNGAATIPITAEDGTKITYSITITALEVTVEEIEKNADTDVRNSYVLFSISAAGNLANVHLALKERDENPPMVQEMKDYALKRDIGTTPINVLIAQRMNAPMITFAKTFFDDTTQSTGGDGMTINPSSDPNNEEMAIAFDGIVSSGSFTKATEPWVEDSLLKPSTNYTLYGMYNETVQSLGDFSTDASPTSWTQTTTQKDLVGLDTTVHQDNNNLTLTLNSDEYYIIPLQTKLPDSKTAAYYNLYYSQQISDNNVIKNDFTLFTVPDAGMLYQISMFPHNNTLGEVFANSFVLVDTAHITKPSNTSNVSWGVSIRYADGQTSAEYNLSFSIQD